MNRDFFVMVLVTLASGQVKAARTCPNCSVVFVALDALQAKHVHHLGYERNTTPFIDQLAGRGYSFADAISPASWTIPAFLSILSSTYPSVHGLTNRYTKFTAQEKVVANFTTSNPKLQTLAYILESRGYKTAGFTGDSGLGAALGFGRGYDVYTDETPFGGFANSLNHATQWLKGLTPQDRFFVFVHGYDCHGQFQLPAPYRGTFLADTTPTRFQGTPQEQAQLRELGLAGKFPQLTAAEKKFWVDWYDSKILDADARVHQIYRTFEEKNLLANTIFVLFSDHGTEFAEHGRFDHGHSLYDELLQVLLVIVPPWKMTGQVIRQQVSTIDLLPTLLSLLEIRPDAELQRQMVGQSLTDFFVDKSAIRPEVFSETDYRNATHKRSVRTQDGWKYIITLEDGTDELYNLRRDPMEKVNLVASDPNRASQLRRLLMDHVVAMGMRPAATAQDCLPAYRGQCE